MDTQAMIDTVCVLAEDIGPRRSASEAEAQAAEYVAGRLERLGYRVRTEPFRGLATFGWVFVLVYAGFVLAALIQPVTPIASAVLALLSAAAFVAESNATPWLGRLLPTRPSRNVVAIGEPASPPVRRVVLVAHLDASRAGLLWHPKLVAGFRRSFLAMVAAMGLVVVLSVIGVFFYLDWWWLLQIAAAAYLAVSIGVLVHRELQMPLVPGANDNASGVAVVLAAAEALTDLQSTELWVVGTGCEESGLGGMMALLNKHRSLSPDTTYVVNVDNCGAGQVRAVTEEGLLWSYPAAPELVSLARQAIQEEGLDASLGPYRTLTTDALVAMTRGLPALSIMAMDRDGILPNWHWPTDTVEHVDPACVETAARLVVALVRRLDSQA